VMFGCALKTITASCSWLHSESCQSFSKKSNAPSAVWLFMAWFVSKRCLYTLWAVSDVPVVFCEVQVGQAALSCVGACKTGVSTQAW
jgi:hypothetical protein